MGKITFYSGTFLTCINEKNRNFRNHKNDLNTFILELKVYFK